MHPAEKENTAVCTQDGSGLFEFNVMPFALCNAPATFQRLMDCVLAGWQWLSCLVYLDDVIILGRSFPEHLCRRRAFSRILLSYIQTFVSWLTSTNQKQVQQFLGLCNYYRHSIQDFPTVAKPLHWLTVKICEFKWSDQCAEAFRKLKQRLLQALCTGHGCQ